eukprot:3640970-Alexandrium_andersonii.AAC.1
MLSLFRTLPLLRPESGAAPGAQPGAPPDAVYFKCPSAALPGVRSSARSLARSSARTAFISAVVMGPAYLRCPAEEQSGEGLGEQEKAE